MNRAFIIHGYEGVPDDAWKPWLRTMLEARGFEVTVPAMPDPAKPQLGPWRKTIEGSVGEPDENCFFVGHSLGCVAILRYIESLDDQKSVGGAVLIAGFASLGNPLLASFFEPPLDWPLLRQRCRRFVVIHSNNDPHIAMTKGEELESKLGAKMIVVPSMGHFGAGDGVTELPIVLEQVLEMQS